MALFPFTVRLWDGARLWPCYSVSVAQDEGLVAAYGAGIAVLWHLLYSCVASTGKGYIFNVFVVELI